MNSTLQIDPYVALTNMQKSLQFIIDYKYEKDEDYSNCKEKLVGFQKKACEIHSRTKDKEVSVKFRMLNYTINNLLNAPESSQLPMDDKTFKIITNYLSMPDLLSLRGVNRRTKMIVNEDLRLQAIECGYVQGNVINKYLTDLKKEFESAIFNDYLPKRNYLYVESNGWKRKLAPFKIVLNEFLLNCRVAIDFFSKSNSLSVSFKLMSFQHVTLIRKNLAKPSLRDSVLNLLLIRIEKEARSLIYQKNEQEGSSDCREELFLRCKNINPLSKLIEASIENTIENALKPFKIFPIADDTFEEMISYLSLPDLLNLNKVSRFARKITRKALNLHAEKFGYTQSSPAKHYLRDLKREFRIAVHYAHVARDVYVNDRKRELFDTLLRKFQNLSNELKFRFLSYGRQVQNLVSSFSYINMRGLIHAEISSPKSSASMIEPRTIHNIISLKEKNLLKFLLDGFIYDGRSTPLHYAVQIGDLDSVEYLVEQDPTAINQPGLRGATPLCFACGLYPFPPLNFKVVNFLLAAGANPNIKTASDLKGQYPIHFAIKADRKDLVELLVEFNANLNVRDEEGKTPLELAESLNLQEIVAYLKSS